MKRPLFFYALLSVILASRLGVAQQVVQPTRPQSYPPQPQPVVQQPRPAIQPPRPPFPPQRPYPTQPIRPSIQPPRQLASGWVPVAVIAVRQPVGHAGAMLSGAYHNFRYLKLRVNNRALTLDHLLVSYDKGPGTNLPLRYRLLPGRDSAPLSMRTLNGRSIRRVDLWYNTDGGLFNPVSVTVLGMR